ncbi:PP2C family protein-serine/threonine phosphatase [Streptomyces sp. NPDC008001]|uniref:PP2C family protein-serine/threonine phosphatase n=1 Tax=Streptomyces sp. NPDC008001 TaxID=3364804 RepID=UPI0036E2B151
MRDGRSGEGAVGKRGGPGKNPARAGGGASGGTGGGDGGPWRSRAVRRAAAHTARRAARRLPAVLIAGGVLFDLGAPTHYSSAPFLSAAPLVAAPLHTLRATVAAALAAVAVAVGLALYHRPSGTGEALSEIATIATIGTVALVALGINRIARRSDQQLASARGIAEAAQRAVLPAPPSRIGGLRVAARYVAAQADARIGGDLYAVQDTPHGVRVIVGDVRGKGLGAVEAVAVVIGAFREAAEQEPTLEGLAGRLERALQREGRRRGNLDQYEGFTTAVLVELPPGKPVLRLLNRGHPPPLLLHADGRVGVADPAVPALPLGLGELGVWPDRAEEREFPAGATLLLMTDGVTEARDADGAFYDPRAGLTGRQFKNPEALLDCLVADVARHSGGQAADDMALLAIRRGERIEQHFVESIDRFRGRTSCEDLSGRPGGFRLSAWKPPGASINVR